MANWFKKAQQQYLWNDDPELEYSNIQSEKENWDKRFPRAGAVVSGLEVINKIDNKDSIDASLENYYTYEGIRECPMSYFGTGGYANINETKRSERLAQEIKIYKKITPLIVVIDNEGPYILEGGHRIQALQILGIKSFPALVVLDQEQEQYELV